LILFAKCLLAVLVVLLAVSKAEIIIPFLMDRKKLQLLREKIEAIALPEAKDRYGRQYNQDEALQKALAATATTAVGLVGKAKLVRGGSHQKKLVELAEKLKVTGNAFSHSLVDIATLRTARTSLLRILKTVDDESRKVFIVHGRDDAMRKDAQGTLNRFGIDGIVLFEEINEGQTIIEKFDREAKACGYAIVLFSPDDLGGIRVGKTAPKLSPRARQNVVLELGYFVALLGRKNVFVLVAGSGLEQPSDFHGVVYETYDKAGAWKRRLANELSTQGFYIDPAVLKKL
jgi:predicted nucleotide-binding protein